MKDVFYWAVAISTVILGGYLFGAGNEVALKTGGIFIIALGACGISWLAAPHIAGGLGMTFYSGSGKINRSPEQMTRLEGMAISGEAAEAAAELQEILKKSFNLIDARTLLVNIYLNHLHDREAAKSTMKQFFTSPRHLSSGESLDLLLLYGDLLDADAERHEAIQYFEQELKRGKYSKADKTLLTNRLNALRNS